MNAVAHAMGYANVKSAGNRWATLKKKHNIDLDAFYSATVCIFYSSSLHSADRHQTAGTKVTKSTAGPSKAQGSQRTPKKSAEKGTKKGPPQESEDAEDSPAEKTADEANASDEV